MPTTPPAIDIDSAYTLSDEQIDFFRRRGFIKLKQVLSPETLEHYRRVITQRVIELNDLANVPWEQRDTYQKAFIQVMNLWLKDDTVKEFVFGKRLARLAAELMGVDGVRLYHDQALYKEPSKTANAGHTPWHADQYYWPIDTTNTCTAWIPLHAVPLEAGPLSFAAESHHHEIGRDLEISDESEAVLQRELAEAGFDHVVEPFDLGEVSFHYGWTYHRAGPNTSQQPREVMTVIYMDQTARVTEPKNTYQVNDHNTWLPGTAIGGPAASKINPVLYHKD
ncbi:phytanoyl-CoA dioxygenase family protein [Planctomycetales bacterium ZRK34]|nr:phytanoyl-CoA dioxygenase family protein [Planctomycetales bacterium ZRK34]